MRPYSEFARAVIAGFVADSGSLIAHNSELGVIFFTRHPLMNDENKVVPLMDNMDNNEENIERKSAKWPGRKGIYLLPNLFTTGALFSGFYAIVASMNGNFENAAIAIFIAMVLDGMDGRVARLTNTQSDFGAEYDSLADMVSFGVAPALVSFTWALQDLGKIGWVAAFIYVAGAALRLARFNTQLAVADKNFFTGLASPAAAAIVAVAPARTIAAALGVAMDKNDGSGSPAVPVLVVTPTVGGGSSSSTSTTSVSGSPS